MKNFKKIGALLFLSAYLIIGLSFVSPVLAANYVCLCNGYDPAHITNEQYIVANCTSSNLDSMVIQQCEGKCSGRENIASCALQTIAAPAQIGEPTIPNSPSPSNIQQAAEASVRFTPQITIPGSEFQQGASTSVGGLVGATTTSDLLARYVAAFYNWGLSIVGVLAVLMLMAGGITWLTSGGDSGKIGNAKKMIEGSLLGTFLLLGAYFFLNTINPDLKNLPAIEMGSIKRVNFGCCDKTIADGKAAMTSDNKCVSGNFYANKQLNAASKCEAEICCVLKVAYGNNSAPLLDTCVNTLKSDCSAMVAKANLGEPKATYSYITKTEKCETVPDCTGLSGINEEVSCVGKEDATSEKKQILGETKTYWCYNQIVYFGDGKAGEPCGNEGSKCYSDDEGTGDLFGRSCCGFGTAGCPRAWCIKNSTRP